MDCMNERSFELKVLKNIELKNTWSQSELRSKVMIILLLIFLFDKDFGYRNILDTVNKYNRY